jgi:hypothetical protein
MNGARAVIGVYSGPCIEGSEGYMLEAARVVYDTMAKYSFDMFGSTRPGEGTLFQPTAY